MNTLAMLFSDTYKQCHPRMYVDGLEFLASYLVPRRSMLENTKEMVWYGLQYFNRRYLVEYFNNYFFKLSEEEVIKQYENSMNIQIGEGNYDTENIYNVKVLYGGKEVQQFKDLRENETLGNVLTLKTYQPLFVELQ